MREGVTYSLFKKSRTRMAFYGNRNKSANVNCENVAQTYCVTELALVVISASVLILGLSEICFSYLG